MSGPEGSSNKQDTLCVWCLLYIEVINLSYIALYRKYRPSTFDSIVGQENVTKILKNQINSGKISHAYIFSGTRGTGKTSAAKVFARAINCLNPKDGEPCNECEVCKNILEGNTTDVIEMDAASNNSVENIRQIRQEVVYNTIDVKYRVYIIDEAHMLTTSAFNALLKTLEEPPQNVVFILATTEQHKIPITILSRCLRFEFGRISDIDMLNRVKFVLEEEKIKYEEEAIKFIVKLAEGGLRDALSILDRCISETKDMLSYQDVIRIVGAIDQQIIQEIVENILAYNSVEAIRHIDTIVEKGKDLRQLAYQLTEKFLEKLIETEGKETQKYIPIIDKLSKLDNDLRLTSKPVIVFKSAIVELCNLPLQSRDSGVSSQEVLNTQPLLQKISSLENEIEKLKIELQSIKNTKAVIPNSKSITTKIEKEVYQGVPVENVDKKMSVSGQSEISVEENLAEFADMETFKKNIIERGKLKLYSSLAGAKMYMNDNALVIVTDNSFAYSILVANENIEELKGIYQSMYGNAKNVIIRLQELNQDHTSKMEKILKEKDINYTTLD